MDPLKKIQVEGYAMFAEPELLFGNLDELCCVIISVFFFNLYLFIFLIYFYSYILVYRSPTRFAKSLSVYFFSTRNPSAEVTQGPRTF